MTSPNVSPQPAWGHDDRYYAASGVNAGVRPHQAEAALYNRWAKALNEASPDVHDAVERTVKQWNGTLRDYLRNETALRLTAGTETQSVPVKVVNGMPTSFLDVMRKFDGLEWLLLNRPALLNAASGTKFMEGRVEAARSAWGDGAGLATSDDIQRVHETANAWLTKLEELGAVEQLTEIREDVLGAYFFRVPEIRLYWVVIGIISRALGVTAEALTIVVLAHELAHAYTHLGLDIDIEHWDTAAFAACELDIVEGLAQFYTQVVCQRLAPRMPAALVAYEELLKRQSAPYKAHLSWVENDKRGGEIVRISMIECRSKGTTALKDFVESVTRHRTGIRRRRR